MKKTLLRLYPKYQNCSAQQNLFLSENLHRHKTPIIYACFISSLDGRIAIQQNGREALPADLSNPNDLSFFYELEAQADCIITNSSYMRARAENRLGDILHIGQQTGDYAYLAEWRQQENLPAQPLIVICSRSLDFPEPDDLPRDKVLIVTGNQHPQDKLSFWRQKKYEVLVMDKGAMVDGRLLIEELTQRHYRSIFLAAGPVVFESVFAGQCLHRLYLTITHQLIGGRVFRTFTSALGRTLPACQLQQRWMIYDCSEGLSHTQWYSCFNCRYASTTGEQ